MKLLIIVFLVATSAAQSYRLPTHFSPQNYDLKLNLPSAIFTEANARDYSGSVAITFTSSSDNVNEVSLHASGAYLKIKSASVISGETSINVIGVSLNGVTDILTVSLASPLTINQAYVMTLDFDGQLSNSDMYGLYKSSYTGESNQKYYLVTTQMAPTYARRVFPCFDEPSYKATFNISLTYPPEFEVLSNSDVLSTTTSADNTAVTTVFNPTPVMSTYLVAFTVSRLTCSQQNYVDPKIQVCSREDAATLRDLASQIAPLAINILNNLTGISYNASVPKLDLVAVPDTAFSAMENWGLLTFRERALLYDANESSNSYRQNVVTAIIHEIAHQWFGNLVTCKWWSETFLNEGFATFFEYLITSGMYPSYEMDKQFVIKNLQNIFVEDAASTTALRADVLTPSEILGRFGGISYNKGASILRMVRHIFGNDELLLHELNIYLSQFTHSSADSNDLWTALNTNVIFPSNFPAENLSTVMENWIANPGYPLLTVRRNGNLFIFSQKRFVYNNRTATNMSWYIPISFASANNPSDFNILTPTIWLKPSITMGTTISPGSWLIINVQQTGYYRVNYDSGLWAAISTALLQSNFSGIPEINRAQIVDDTFNLARGGYLNYSEIFNINQFLANDTSYFVWYPALTGFNYMLKRFGENSTLGKSILSHISTLSKAFIASVPLNETYDDIHIYSLKQELAQSWACKLGDSNCIASALEYLAVYKNTGSRPPKNLRQIVYSYGLKHSTDISADWDFLWNKFLDTTLPSEQLVILSALGSTTDKAILNMYLQKTLTDNSGIRPQDYAAVFTAVSRGSAVGVDVALDFWINNYNDIIARYTSSDGGINLLRDLANEINTEEQFKKLQYFISNNNLTGSLLEAANAALTIAEDNYEYVNTYQNDLYSYYKEEENSTPSPSTNSARRPFVTMSIVMLGLICITS